MNRWNILFSMYLPYQPQQKVSEFKGLRFIACAFTEYNRRQVLSNFLSPIIFWHEVHWTEKYQTDRWAGRIAYTRMKEGKT